MTGISFGERFTLDPRFFGAALLIASSSILVIATPAAGQTVVRVRDDFSVDSFSNNDGPDAWSGPWIEDDPQSGGAGPAAGQVQVSGGFLRLDDYPNTGGEPSAAREVDLTGAVSAELRFSWWTSSGVDSDDAVTVEVSPDGGATWSTLEVITGVSGAVSESRTFNISAAISADTRIRFRVSNKYGGSNESFLLDSIEIEGFDTSCRNVEYRDRFDNPSFTNDDGASFWSGPWVENDPEAGGAGPSSGQVRVTGGSLRLDDQPDTGGVPGVDRGVFLEGATGATLKFDFRTSAGVDTSDAVTVDVSLDGGSTWHTLEVLTGIIGEVSSSRSYDITAYAAEFTRIRFRVTNLYGGSDEFFYLDEVTVTGTCVVPVELLAFVVE